MNIPKGMKKYIASLLACVIAVCAFAPFSASADGTYAGEHFDVPQIRVTTKDGVGNTLVKEDGYVDASIVITDMDGSTIESPIIFKVRGNSTSMTLKKPFTFKFPKKTDVFGFGKAKRWVLLANAYDVTFIRNYFSFDWAQRMGIPYTSEQKIVELWVDDMFKGCYTLMEPITDGKGRVEIDTTGEKDFIVEWELKREEEDVTYFTANSYRFGIKEPDPPTEAQVNYIKSTMENVITTLESGDREAIEEAIDVDSFVRYYLLNEFVKVSDFYFSSVFFFYKDGKLYAGPPWDYDLSMGNVAAVSTDPYNPEGVFAANKNIVKYLCKLDWFNEKARDLYKENYSFLENTYSDGGYFDSFYEKYEPVISRNFNEAGWVIWHKLITVHERPFPTYEENLDYLKNWCKTRNDWLYDYFKLGDDMLYIKGDADGNGVVDISDATLIQKLIGKIENDDDGQITTRADSSDDGLDINDVTLLQRYIAGMEKNYRFGEKIFK